MKRSLGSSRSHSSSKCSKYFVSSSNECTFSRGSEPLFWAQSSQNGQPVSGEKCHAIISRTCASSWEAASEGFIKFAIRPQPEPARRRERALLRDQSTCQWWLCSEPA